jgi:hypothetical protein
LVTVNARALLNALITNPFVAIPLQKGINRQGTRHTNRNLKLS